MKMLLILPILLILMACEQQEESENKSQMVLEQAVIILELNETFLESEIIFGETCVNAVQKTGNIKNDDCDVYFAAQTISENATVRTSVFLLDIFFDGLVDANTPEYDEILDTLARLVVLEGEASAMKLDVDKYIGSDCVKCAI